MRVWPPDTWRPDHSCRGKRRVPRPRAQRAVMAPATRQTASEASSSIDVSEDEVEAGEDGDDVGHVDPAHHPGHDADVVEAGRADLDPERAEVALADDVVAHLAERVLRRDPRLTGGHLDDARHLGHDRAGGQAVDQL